jgi:vacuolar-type H+-ATPase subunit H
MSAPSLQVPDSSPASTSAPALQVPESSPSEPPPAPATLAVPELPSSTSAPSLQVPDSSREATATPSNDNSLLSFEAASHAERNPDGITQTSRTLKKLTDAQKATRKIRQETERRAQELLSKDLDGLLTRHHEELEELAEQHGKKVEAIDKLMTTGHYKHKRSVNIENAKIHMKSQEVNAGKSSSSPVLAISILSIFINRSKHGGPSTTV